MTPDPKRSPIAALAKKWRDAAKKRRLTIEQRAVSLAEYKTAFRESRGVLRRDMASSLEEDRQAAHDIAMLLVKRELEAGDG